MSRAIDAPYDGLYQVAYVTNDFERALKQFGDTHRIAQFMQLPKLSYVTGPGREAVCNIALAYVGAIEIEVIEPLEGDVQLYRDYLPKDGTFAVPSPSPVSSVRQPGGTERQVETYRAQGRAVPSTAPQAAEPRDISTRTIAPSSATTWKESITSQTRARSLRRSRVTRLGLLDVAERQGAADVRRGTRSRPYDALLAAAVVQVLRCSRARVRRWKRRRPLQSRHQLCA